MDIVFASVQGLNMARKAQSKLYNDGTRRRSHESALDASNISMPQLPLRNHFT